MRIKHKRYMIDPNDFVDNNQTEGEESRNTTKSGYPGIGGMTTKDAEDAYDQASKEHFRDDFQKKGGKTKRHVSEVSKNKSVSKLPQIGSIEDIENDEEG